MRGHLRAARSARPILGLHLDLEAVNSSLMPDHVVGARENPVAARKAARILALVIRLLQHDPLRLCALVMVTIRGRRADRQTATIYKVN